MLRRVPTSPGFRYVHNGCMTTPRSTFRITATAHDDCARCTDLAENAETIARATGSVGATYDDAECSATVAREPEPLRSY